MESCATRFDVFSSPFSDRIRRSVGDEFEYVLHKSLRNRGIAFLSERELRCVGVGAAQVCVCNRR